MLPLSPVYLVPLGFVVSGSPFVAIGIVFQRKNAAVRDWPRVMGRIVSSTLQTSSAQRRDNFDPNWAPTVPNDQSRTATATYCSADARFTYEVDGKTHEGTTISREGISGGWQNAKAWVDRHPPGTEVSVYVDPRDATTAYLEWKRWSVGSLILLIWGSVLMFIGVLVFVIFLCVGP